MTKITSSAICSKGTMALRIEFKTTCRPAIITTSGNQRLMR